MSSVIQEKEAKFVGDSSPSMAFNSDTTSGSLLLCVLIAAAEYSGAFGPLVFSAPTTSGLTWVHVDSVQGNFDLYPSGVGRSYIDIYYAAGASAVLSSTSTSSTLSGQSAAEFTTSMILVEVDVNCVGLGPIGKNVGPSYPDATLPSAGSISGDNYDFVYAVAVDAFGATTASGFTTGVSDSDLGIVSEYKFPTGSGSYDTAWSGSPAWNWSAIGVVFSGEFGGGGSPPPSITLTFNNATDTGDSYLN